MTFPQAPLGVQAGLQLSGSTWTDISSYVLQREGTSPPVTVTRGRPDESSTINPATCGMQWNNRDGRFSPKNATGPYYGQLGRNTPVRVSVPYNLTYLRLEADRTSSASCPDSAGLQITTGTLSVRVDMLLTDNQQAAFVSKWGATAQAWVLEVNNSGIPHFGHYDGTTVHGNDATTALPYVGSRIALRVDYNISAQTITFYTAPSMAGSWTQLGTVVSTGATTQGAGTGQVVQAGGTTDFQGCLGAVYEARVYSTSTLEANPVFTSQTAGATSFTDGQSNTWTMNGTAELSNRSYRFHGEASSLPQSWDPTGTDVYVPVQASGLLRRLQQANSPVRSPMRRSIQSLSNLAAYWPMEDLAGATQIGSAVTGAAPMTFAGAPTLGADSSFPCYNPLPQVGGGSFYGTVPTGLTWTDNVFRFLLFEAAGDIPNSTIVAQMFTTGTVARTEVGYATGGDLSVNGYSAAGALLFTGGPLSFDIDGQLVRVSMNLRNDGANVEWELETYALGGTQAETVTGTIAGSVGAVTRVILNPGSKAMGSTVAGHASVQTVWESIFDVEGNTAADGSQTGPMRAWAGEYAAERFARLCSENSIQSRIYGIPTLSAVMGAQQIDTLSNILQSVEDTDHGMQYEPRQCLGLGYRTLNSLCGQAVAGTGVAASYSSADLGDGQSMLGVTDDDQFTVNDWTVTNNNGSSYQLQLDDGSAMSISPPPAGVGDYASSKTLYLYTDGQLPNTTSWMLNVSTCNELRYPLVPFSLVRSEVAGLFYNFLDVELGDFETITGPPAFLTFDTIRQLVAGVSEGFGGFWFKIGWQCVPASPYDVFIAGDSTFGRANTAGSILAAAATGSATSLVAATPGGPPGWTTNPGSWPFDISVAGERCTITAVANETGSVSSPGTFANILSVTVPPGTYTVQWSVTLSGTLSGSDTNNFSLTNGGVFVASSVNTDVAGTYLQGPQTMTVVPANPFIQVISAGTHPTAGATYAAAFLTLQQLTVTRNVNGAGKAQAAGAPVALFFPPLAALT